MVSLGALWLPILLSGIFVFIASSILHMVLPLHRKDYGQLPGEESIRSTIRDSSVPPGLYMFPHADDYKQACTPEHMAKFEEGPVGTMVVLPNGLLSLRLPKFKRGAP